MPLIAAAIERNSSAVARERTSDHAELRSSLTALSQRADASELATTSAMERMTEVIHSLQVNNRSTRAPDASAPPPNGLPLPVPSLNATPAADTTSRSESSDQGPLAQATYDTWDGSPPYVQNGVGRSIGQTPAVLGPEGGAGAGAFGQNSRNPYL